MKLNSLIYRGMLVAGLVLAACNSQAGDRDDTGAVYTMDNAVAGNHILVYERAADGGLSWRGSVATGGLGTGAGLGSQGALALSHDGRWLLACNAGSSEISVFLVTQQGLVLSDKVSSQGKNPISLTLHQNLLYVLNAGGLVGDKDNVTGFLFFEGRLYPVPDSAHALSADNTSPAEVSFSPNGDVLAVTEKGTSMIDTFTIDSFGIVDVARQFPSSGETPYGFAFRDHDLIVSEAFGGATGASAASAYDLKNSGILTTNSASVGTKQTAACWVAVTEDGRYGYTANTGSGNISGYKIAWDGTLSLINPSGITGLTGTGSSPADLAFSHDSHFLYCRSGATGTVSAFQVKADGSLAAITGVSGLPASGAGLVAQ